jgi:molybdopterin molybdotransferase
MMQLEEAQRRLLDGVDPSQLAREVVALEDAPGRVLGADVFAPHALPPFDHATMDGYALRVFDIAHADASASPIVLAVSGESRAGAPPPPLRKGTAMAISTGAPLPAGADAVVPRERTERTGEGVVLRQLPSPGACVRRAGDDLPAGARALDEGTPLHAGRIALLAALDQASVTVFRAPSVTLYSGGDELRAPGSASAPAKIAECTLIGLAHQCRILGARAQALPLGTDDRAALRDTLERALGERGAHRVLITVGGVSAGDHDHTASVLTELGVRFDVFRVAMKPGKPLVAGRAGDSWVVGLPGNPVSAYVSFALFVAPLLRALGGCTNPIVPPRIARASVPGGPFPCGSKDRLELVRGRYVRSAAHASRVPVPEGALTDALRTVEPLRQQASNSIPSLAMAEVLIEVPCGTEALSDGALVRIHPLPGMEAP